MRVPDRSPAAVLNAFREGRFYSSTGPAIDDVTVDGSAVEVRCTPARRVTLLAGRARGASVVAGRLGYSHRGEILEQDGYGLVTAVRLVAPADAPYARIEVRAADGGTAWTNALRA